MSEPLVVEAAPRAAAGPATPPRLSVVVPTRNAGDGVRRLVAALAAQTLPRAEFEVVIADDGSDDGSTARLAMGSTWLTVSTAPPRNSYAARNRGARVARGAALAFCDADCVPEPDWLVRGLESLEHADLVAGRVHFELPRRPSIWALVDVDMFLDQERAVAARRAATANLFVRRAVFDAAGGFDDSVPNQGDHDFVGRAVASGATLSFSREATVHHPPRGQARELLTKVWRVNYMYALRVTCAGRRPRRLT